MNLEDMLLEKINRLGTVKYMHSFGWICINRGKNLFGGYKIIDNNILLLFLILSPDKFKDSLDHNFEQFNFGKTWVQSELLDQQDLNRVEPFILNAYNFAKVRNEKKQKKLKN